MVVVWDCSWPFADGFSQLQTSRFAGTVGCGKPFGVGSRDDAVRKAWLSRCQRDRSQVIISETITVMVFTSSPPAAGSWRTPSEDVRSDSPSRRRSCVRWVIGPQPLFRVPLRIAEVAPAGCRSTCESTSSKPRPAVSFPSAKVLSLSSSSGLDLGALPDSQRWVATAIAGKPEGEYPLESDGVLFDKPARFSAPSAGTSEIGTVAVSRSAAACSCGRR